MTKMIYCDNCGAEVTAQRLHYYIRDKVYCYDCFQKFKRKPNNPKSKNKIRDMINSGKKPSQIAKELNISIQEVYERATKRYDD